MDKFMSWIYISNIIQNSDSIFFSRYHLNINNKKL
jgi:hypothetical protein